MPNNELEKVLEGLECCHDLRGENLCSYCPYKDAISRYHCQSELMTDALELLKAQQEKDELQKEEMAGVDSAFDKIIGDMRELLEKTTPKVMTLDEVAKLKEHQFVWVETNDSDESVYFLEIVQLCGIVSINMEISLNAPSLIYFVYTKD